RKIVGRSSELGATTPSQNLFVPPAAASPTTDDLIFMNSSPNDAEISIVLTRPGQDPLHPAALDSIRLASGSRMKVPIAKYTDGDPMGALVVSTAPVIAERSAYSHVAHDVASVMAIPLPRPSEGAPAPSTSP
ncbi:MAG: hypothetical protein M3290_03405, partial [Actinomycetota bacterium]|nr:hypothetical protein [Actinomycetota bacterium]